MVPLSVDRRTEAQHDAVANRARLARAGADRIEAWARAGFLFRWQRDLEMALQGGRADSGSVLAPARAVCGGRAVRRHEWRRISGPRRVRDRARTERARARQ